MMGNEIVVVDGMFALTNRGRVIGVVSRTPDKQWAFHPLVPGVTHGTPNYIPLTAALEVALKFIPEA